MKTKIKIFLVRFLLAFLAANVLMMVIGLFFPLTKHAAEGNHMANGISLLSLDESRDYTPYKVIDNIDGLTCDNVENYGEAYLFNDGSADSITYEVSVGKTGTYEIAVDYYSLQESVTNISINVLIDGKYITKIENGKEVEDSNYLNINLKTAWQEEVSEPSYDIYNNEVAKVQLPYRLWRNVFLQDQRYYQDNALKFELTEGTHQITIERNLGDFYLGNLYLYEASPLKAYSELGNKASSGANIITLEGEKPLFKTDTIIQNSSVQNPNMYPYSTEYNRLNVLSGDSFNQSGYGVTYAFYVEEDGNYEFTFKYANTQSNTISYADIYIDNVLVCDELNQYKFMATSEYKNETLKSSEGTDMSFPLTKGYHTITIQIDSSIQSEIYRRMFDIVEEISDLYLEVVKLTGGDIDSNKKWEIEKYLPHADDCLNRWVSEIDVIIDLIDKHSKVDSKKDNTLCQYVENARRKIKAIADKPNELPHELSNLCTGTSSAATLLSNSLHTSTFAPISIDRIYIHEKDAKLPKAGSNFFLSYFSAVQRVVKSGVNIEDSDDMLEVWVNRSTYYVSTLQKYADANFTPETGIKVRFSLLPDESKLTYAYAAGTHPDMALGVGSGSPYDLGLRGALEDMTQFEGFNEVAANFAAGAFTNLTCPGDDKDGDGVRDAAIYGIPETQDFQILYYRKDILDQLGLECPNTWVDVIEMLPTLQRFGMNFYIPMAGGSGLKGISSTAPFIYQYGGDIYSSDYMTTDIDSKEAIQAINLMVDLFQLYSLPLTSQNFYDSFRNGKIPAGVGGFDIYLQLTNAAPELQGKWGVALHPGVQRDINGDGVVEENEIDRTATGDTRNAIIFKKTKNKEKAWRFIEWWSQADVQSGYANIIQSTYGATFLWNTANLEAFQTLAIGDDIKAVASVQLKDHLRNINQIPATYMVERGLSNVWNNAVFNNSPLRALITDSKLEIDKEIARKMQEFGFMDSKQNVIQKYQIFTLEDIRQMQEEGSK